MNIEYCLEKFNSDDKLQINQLQESKLSFFVFPYYIPYNWMKIDNFLYFIFVLPVYRIAKQVLCKTTLQGVRIIRLACYKCRALCRGAAFSPLLSPPRQKLRHKQCTKFGRYRQGQVPFKSITEYSAFLCCTTLQWVGVIEEGFHQKTRQRSSSD